MKNTKLTKHLLLTATLFVACITANAQILTGGLSGSNTRLLQVNSSGDFVPLTQGTSSQVLFGNGTWGSLPSFPTTIWNTTGNAAATGDFLGTTNLQNLIFKTNNQTQATLTTGGVFQLNNLAGTGTRFLQADANGNLISFAAGTSSQVLFGNGTWGSLPSDLWSANGSSIFYNASGAKVGIGNNNPQVTLDVTGDAKISGTADVGTGITFGGSQAITYTTISGGPALIPQINLLTNTSVGGYLNVSQGLTFDGAGAGLRYFSSTVPQSQPIAGTLVLSANTNVNGALNVGSLAGTGNGQIYVDANGNLQRVNTANSNMLTACDPSNPAWLTGGNTLGTITNAVIGTCDDKDFVMEANGIERIRIGASVLGGRVLIGGSDLAVIPNYNNIPGNWADKLIVKNALRVIDDDPSTAPSKCGLFGNDGVHTYIESFNLDPENPGQVSFSPDDIRIGWTSGANVSIAQNPQFGSTGGNLSVQRTLNADKIGVGTSTPSARMSIVAPTSGNAFSIDGTNTLFSVGFDGTTLINSTSPTLSPLTLRNNIINKVLFEVLPTGNTHININTASTQVEDAFIISDLSSGSGGNFRVRSNGTTYIGTKTTELPNSPHHDALLAVYGKALFTSAYVNLNGPNVWSDYVFEKNYKLMSLNEVEKYYLENKHLPGVPSAKEMVVTGDNIVETDAMLLKKIEELTLYMVEQQKKIKELEQKLDAFKK